MADYNIEFAHIYADEEFGEEQKNSINILLDIIKKIKKENKTFVTTILVDEFNATKKTLDIKMLLEKIKERGITLDYIAFESRFREIGDNIIREIPSEKLKIEYFNNSQKEVLFLNEKDDKVSLKIKSDSKLRHTCAMLSAAWALCRLKFFSAPVKALNNAGLEGFYADNLITILPRKYACVEAKVAKIITATKFKKCLKHITYYYF